MLGTEVQIWPAVPNSPNAFYGCCRTKSDAFLWATSFRLELEPLAALKATRHKGFMTLLKVTDDL